MVLTREAIISAPFKMMLEMKQMMSSYEVLLYRPIMFIHMCINCVVCLTPVAVAVDTHPTTSNISIGENFTLTCTASAFPLPNITWLHNDSIVIENSRITTTQTTTPRTVTSSITINNATVSDSGTYVCRVGAPSGTNFNTTASDTALILVQGGECINVCAFVTLVYVETVVMSTLSLCGEV